MKWLSFILLLCVFFSCTLDKRLYRNGYFVDKTNGEQVNKLNDKSKNFCDTIDNYSVDQNNEFSRSFCALDQNKAIFALESTIQSDNVSMADFDIFENNVKQSVIKRNWFNKSIADDSVKVHPLLTGATIGSFSLTGAFLTSLIYRLVKHFAAPYWFPQIGLIMILLWGVILTVFLIGKRKSKKNPEKWKQNRTNRIAFTLLLILGAINVVYFFYYVIYVFINFI